MIAAATSTAMPSTVSYRLLWLLESSKGVLALKLAVILPGCKIGQIENLGATEVRSLGASALARLDNADSIGVCDIMAESVLCECHQIPSTAASLTDSAESDGLAT